MTTCALTIATSVSAPPCTVSLPWPIPRAWFYSIPLAASCVSMLATCIYLILAEIATLAGVKGVDTAGGIMGLQPAAEVRA